MTDQQKNALKMAREDLWFLNMESGIHISWRWRTLATAEYITKALGDSADFENTLGRWFAEGPTYGTACLVALNHVRDTGPKEA